MAKTEKKTCGVYYLWDGAAVLYVARIQIKPSQPLSLLAAQRSFPTRSNTTGKRLLYLERLSCTKRNGKLSSHRPSRLLQSNSD